MRKLVVSMHVSLDGFVAGPSGEMDWIRVSEELFDYIVNLTDQADMGMYGRVTYQMMNSYWPTAGDKPNASRHDVEHSRWYNRVEKVVLSNSLKGNPDDKTQVIGGDLVNEIQALKQKPGKNIQMFGSPTAAHALMQHDLIDAYWLFVNPVLLGTGIPLFGNIGRPIDLSLVGSRTFGSGVVELHYER